MTSKDIIARLKELPTDKVKFAIVDIDDIHLLTRQHAGGIHQVPVDGQRPDIVQVGLRHGGAMDLGLEYLYQHGGEIKQNLQNSQNWC